MSAVFVPAFYSKAQQQYIESFFKQNGFIDYSLLKKIGITENAESYLKALFPDQTIKYMSGSCFTSYFIDQIEQELDDHLNRVGFCDLSVSNLYSRFLPVRIINILLNFFGQ